MLKSFCFQFPDLAPISINACYSTDFKSKRRFKSKEYCDFSDKIHRSLLAPPNNKTAKDFVLIKDNLESIGISVIVFTPHSKIYTKNNKKSKNIGDLGNYEKALTDVLFKILGCNDYLIDEINLLRKESIDDSHGVIYNIIIK